VEGTGSEVAEDQQAMKLSEESRGFVARLGFILNFAQDALNRAENAKDLAQAREDVAKAQDYVAGAIEMLREAIRESDQEY
jgi:hypothetical protein